MKISIITVCRNAVKTIEETILSVINQTYQDIEYIVIDGVSTDGTLDIIEKYKNKISKIISEPDKGVYNAMNKGIKLATGDIIYFINANDIIYDNQVLEKVVKHFKDDTQLDFLFGDFQFINHDRTNGAKVIHDKVKTIFTFTLYNICHQVIFYRSKLFKDYGLYDESFKIFADYEFNVKLLVENRVQAKYLNLLVAKFEAGGISTANNDEIFKNHVEERKRIYTNYFKKYHLLLFIFERINRFFQKYFGTLYKFLTKNTIFLYINNFIINFINVFLKIKLNIN